MQAYTAYTVPLCKANAITDLILYGQQSKIAKNESILTVAAKENQV